MAKKTASNKGPSHASRKAQSKTKTKTTRKVPTSRTVKKKPATKKTSAVRKSKSGAAIESRLRKLDKEILKLINERAQLTTDRIQAEPNLKKTLYDPKSDDRLWQELAKANPGPLPENAVRGVFRQILSAARQKVKTSRVAYLGPPLSFTHIAAIERFGEQSDLVPVSTIASVFGEVNRGHADYGLVPIANSTDGRIIDTLDMFRRLPLRICGEVQISVHHNLLSRCPRSEITDIYSKPQAISQCRDWLARNMPQAGLHEVTSTSAAAQLAQQARGAAAVASRQAAVQYDLNVIAENIEDSSKNVTRFAVVGDDVCPPSGEDRTSILLQIPHQPGSLTDALTIFKKGKINLTWIESFPLRGEEDGYLFLHGLRRSYDGHANQAGPERSRKAGPSRCESLGLIREANPATSRPAPLSEPCFAGKPRSTLKISVGLTNRYGNRQISSYFSRPLDFCPSANYSSWTRMVPSNYFYHAIFFQRKLRQHHEAAVCGGQLENEHDACIGPSLVPRVGRSRARRTCQRGRLGRPSLSLSIAGWSGTSRKRHSGWVLKMPGMRRREPSRGKWAWRC